MRKTILAAGMLAFGLANTASAADLPVKAAPIAVVAPYNWTGVYVTGSLGIGWQSVKGAYVLPPPDGHSSDGTKGWYGGHLGFQYQFANRWVIGIEGTWTHPWSSDWTSSASPSSACLASLANRLCEHRFGNVYGVGGRLGYAAWQRVLLYGVGGWARAQISTRDRIATTGVVNVIDPGSYSHSGWYIGAGLDYFLASWGFADFIFGIEYRHYDFGTVRHFPVNVAVVPATAFAVDQRDMKATLDMVTARLSLKFWPR